MKSTFKYLLRLWLLLLTISVPACFLILQVWYKIPDEPTGQAYICMLISFGMFAILAGRVSSRRVFLNVFKNIRRNTTYRLLSFFTLPLIVCIFMAEPISSSFKEGLPVILPFFISLAVEYMLFSKWLRINKNIAVYE